MTSANVNARLLVVAAKFIRNHANGTDAVFKELMADAVDEAARAAAVGVLPIKIAKRLAPPVLPSEVDGIRHRMGAGPLATVNEEEARALLYAAGYTVVRRSTIRVYVALVNARHRAHTSEWVGKKTGRSPQAVRWILRGLVRHNAIIKPSIDTYQAT